MIAPGSVWRVSLPDQRGHEQRGPRPVVVIQEQPGDWSTVIVVPCSTRAAPLSFRVEIEIDGEETVVLCDQVRAIDVTRLRSQFATVDPGALADIRSRIADLIGLRNA